MYISWRGGFHKKYFKGKSWSNKLDEIWESAESRYDAKNKCWKSLSCNPDENEACAWLPDLEKFCPPDGRVGYFRSTADNKVGPKTKRQIDLFVKDKIQGSSLTDEKHGFIILLLSLCRHVCLTSEHMRLLARRRYYLNSRTSYAATRSSRSRRLSRLRRGVSRDVRYVIVAHIE